MVVSSELFFQKNNWRFNNLSKEAAINQTLILSDEYRELVREHIKQLNPKYSEVDLKIEIFKWFYEKDYSPEEMEKIILFFRKKGGM